MTKREYLDECMEVWKWSERHPTASVSDKEQAWPYYHFGCPACEYVDRETQYFSAKPISSCSKVCLIQWTKEHDPEGCEAAASPYAKWREAGGSKDEEVRKIKYARQVQDLIRDAIRKLDEEEPVAHEGRVFAEDLIVGKEYLRFYLGCKEPARFTYLNTDNVAPEWFICQESSGEYRRRSYADCGMEPYGTGDWSKTSYTVKTENSNYNTDGAKYKVNLFWFGQSPEKTFRSIIEQFKLKDKQEEAKWKVAHLRQMAELGKLDKGTDTLLFTKLRRANVKDYRTWLKNYILNGGSPTHSYDRNLPKRFYVATEDFEIFPLRGAQSISIIVPKGIKFLGGELGHCNIFFIEDYTVLGGCVPIYADV